MTANVFEAGTLKLASKIWLDREGVSRSGALASYEFSSAEKMYQVASRHKFVVRPNGKRIKSENYTLNMAKNDFNA